MINISNETYFLAVGDGGGVSDFHKGVSNLEETKHNREEL